MLRRHLLGSVAGAAIVTAICAPVLGADLKPAKVPPITPAPYYGWAGFYLGGHAGYGWGKSRGDMFDDGTGISVPLNGDLNLNGIALGLQTGYNWQTGQWVYGIEGDATLTPGWNKSACSSRVGADPIGSCTRFLVSSQMQWLASVRGRLGMAFDRTLIYATGGVAFAKASHSAYRTDTFISFQHVSTGAVVGGGVEWKYDPSLSLRLEGLYYMFNNSSTNLVDTVGFTTAVQGVRNTAVVRLGVNWFPGAPGFASSSPPLVTKGPAVPYVAPGWSGFYLGAHAGYGWSNTRGDMFDDGTPGDSVPLSGDLKANGVALGVQTGYNWQTGSWVYGLEGDATVTPGWQKSACSFRTTTFGPVGVGSCTRFVVSSQLHWLASARARLGMTFDRTLVYATGGVAFAKASHRAYRTDTFIDFTRVSTGAVVGGGVEWRYNPSLSLRLEGLYYMFNDSSTNLVDTFGQATAVQGLRNATVVRAGMNFFPGALGGAAAPALATRGPALPYVSSNWAGFYVGGHVGYGWSKFQGDMFNTDPTDGSVPLTGNVNADGIALGGHAGYNWQTGSWVYGLEGDATVTPGWQKSVCAFKAPPFGAGSCTRFVVSSQLEWLASVRGRLGMAFDRTLVYATGGVAFAKASHRAYRTETFIDFTRVSTGAVVGGGVEWKYNSKLSLRLEGLYYMFNNSTTNLVDSPSDFATQGLRNASVVRAGASWHWQ
jgi:outer membrane immunogenic protein